MAKTKSSGKAISTKIKSGEMGHTIMKEAKRIRKERPSMSWTDCVAKAGKKVGKK